MLLKTQQARGLLAPRALRRAAHLSSRGAAHVDVEVSIELRHVLEGAGDELVLLYELLHGGPLGQLHRLGVTLRPASCRTEQRLVLMNGVANRHDVGDLPTLEPPAETVYLLLEGQSLPLPRRHHAPRLVGGPCREHPQALDRCERRGHEPRTTLLNPTVSGVCDDHHLAELLCLGQCGGDPTCQHGEAAALVRAELNLCVRQQGAPLLQP
mmetsp:Transcript_62561/g.179445  ORF Transcript_62561/g.179445 Transcript_62561/m.179445 type:complete len:211 (+) Transcript_62561:164-796(+)